jgi:hypothetical protein
MAIEFNPTFIYISDSFYFSAIPNYTSRAIRPGGRTAKALGAGFKRRSSSDGGKNRLYIIIAYGEEDDRNKS